MSEQLFFELIRVAIGNQSSLSRLPKNQEWGNIYTIAEKQGLVGICFAGLQRLGADADEGFVRIGMSEMLYLTWMGMAAGIQQRNKIVNRQCVELQTMLSTEGLRSCILKGQGVGLHYPDTLRNLRQSGDIDMWVDALKKEVVDWANAHGTTGHRNYMHVDCCIFEGTEVELHYRPTYMRSMRHNKRLQEFCEKHKKAWTERDGMMVPSWEFDVVYQLSHIYRHLFGLGVGLRQLMDYYWTLSSSPVKGESPELLKTLKFLGLYDFAGAVMYVLRDVFQLEERSMICPVDERRGRMLLSQVLQTGNFGHKDAKQREVRTSALGTMRYKMSQWWKLVKYYPKETLSAPLWGAIREFV